MGGDQSKTSKLQVQVHNIHLQFVYQDKVLNIKGYSQESKKYNTTVYDVYYDDISIPEELYKKIKTVQLIFQKIKDNIQELEVKNDSLFIKTKNQILSLPLGSYQDHKELHLQADISFRIKKIPNQLKIQLPYKAAVMIVSNCNDGAVMKGSGAIIQKGTILTVAHLVYDRTYELEAESIVVYVQTSKGLKKIPVKKHHFPKQYKTINQTDLPKYDFAYLQLQQNDIISSDHVLPLKWDWDDSYKGFQIFGFSQKLDKQFQQSQTHAYHMKCSKAISLIEGFIVYDNKAENGISGGPIVIEEADGKFKLIGLHQGFHRGFSRGVLLSSFGKNPFQILSQLSGFNQKLQNILNPLKDQADEQKLLLKKQIERLKAENKKSHNSETKKEQTQKQNIKNEQKRLNTEKIFNRAKQLFSLKKYEQTQILCNQCLKFQSQFPGRLSLQYSETLHLLGRIYFQRQQLDKSLTYYAQAINIKKKTIGINHQRYTATLNNIGLIYKNTQKYHQALQCFHSCLEIQGELRGKNHQNYMSALANIGYVYMHQKKYEVALKYLLKYESNYQNIIYNDKKQKTNHMINTLGDIGTCYSNLQKQQKCLEYRIKALNFIGNNNNKKSVDYADKLEGVGTIYSILKNPQKSLQYYFQYIQLLQQLKQTKQSNYPMVLVCIIENYQLMNLPNSAQKINPICRKVISTCEANKDIDNQSYLYAMDYYARNLYSQNKFKQSLALYKKLETILGMIDLSLYESYRVSSKQNVEILQKKVKQSK